MKFPFGWNTCFVCLFGAYVKSKYCTIGKVDLFTWTEVYKNLKIKERNKVKKLYQKPIFMKA